MKMNEMMQMMQEAWRRNPTGMQYLQILRCPECSKTMTEHPPEQAYLCLRLLAEKELQKIEDSLTKQ